MTSPWHEAPDALGWRGKFAVLGPSTNTIVQPDMEAMRPAGVTNHYSRIFVENLSVTDNKSFTALTEAITASVDKAIADVLTCAPDRIVMGMSAITFYGGVKGAEAFRDRVADVSGLPTSTGALSTAAALRTFGAKSVSFLSPYFPNANGEVRRFFEESGFAVKRDRCLQCPNPRAIAQVPESALRPILFELDGDDVDAIVQVGTNLSMVRLAAAAERVLGKPVFAINAATYWHALREAGIADAVQGQGRLLSEH